MSFVIKCDRCKITKSENSFRGMYVTFRVEIGAFGYVRHLCSLCDERDMQDSVTKMIDKAKQSINNNQK